MPCNKEACGEPKNDIDCHWGEWHAWSDCSCSCGGGQKTRDRSIIQAPRGNGALCPIKTMAEVEKCNTRSCDEQHCIDGKWTEWSEWGACSASCGGGLRWKTRMIAQEANDCGEVPEGSNQKFEACATDSCQHDKDCEFSHWGSWGDCSCCCGGVKRRYRSIAAYGAGEGRWCEGALTEVEPCTGKHEDCKAEQPGGQCPPSITIVPHVDCKLSDWEERGGCSVTCGGTGQQLNIRRILQSPKNGGAHCEGDLTKFTECVSSTPCPEPKACEWTEWSHWSACDKCAGQQNRAREIKHMPKDGWKPCDPGAAKETRKCTRRCHPPAFCHWSAWSEETDCSATCGVGYHSKKRSLVPKTRRLAVEVASLIKCKGYERKRVKCKVQDCDESQCQPQHCKLGPWGEWGHADTGSCTGLCSRKRGVVEPNNECGNPCTGPIVETSSHKGCLQCPDREHHPPENCEFSQWSHWSKTTTDDDTECKRKRRREVKRNSQHGGMPCEGQLEEVNSCRVHLPGCHLSTWGHWSECSADCGPGQRSRSRQVEGDGTGCGNHALKETQKCEERSCGDVVDCKWSQWQHWSACTCPCGGGQRYRSRTIAQSPKGGGARCDPLDHSEASACNKQPCKDYCIDGKFTEWGAWTGCTAQCGGGLRWRRRKIATEANDCGTPATGKDLDIQPCGQASCVPDVDCELSQWSHWSDCSCTRDGEKQRSRVIARFGSGNGRFCNGELKEVMNCNTAAAPTPAPEVGCDFGDWQETSECQARNGRSCGDGTRTLRRTSKGPCEGALEKIVTCELPPCPKKCEDCVKVCRWDEWEHWESCTKCGGQRKRYRQMHTHEVHNHESRRLHEHEFPHTVLCDPGDSEETGKCPRKCGDSFVCEWTEWHHVGGCSASCGRGTQKKQRTLYAKRLSDAELRALQSDALVQDLGLKTRPETTVFLSFSCGVISFALFLSLWQRCSKSRHTAPLAPQGCREIGAETTREDRLLE